MPDPLFADYLAAPTIAPLLQWRPWLAALTIPALAALTGAAPLAALRIQMIWGERWLMRTAIGLAILPTLVLILGQIPGLLFQIPFWLAIPVVLIWLAVSFKKEPPGTRTGLEKCETRGDRPHNPALRWERIAEIAGWLVLGFWWLLMLPPAFAPPLNYDVLEYHLGIIPEVFATGRVLPVPGVFYTAQPLATEMLYLLGAIGEGRAWGYAPGIVQWLLFVFGALLWRAAARAMRCPASLVPWLWLLWITHPLVFKLQLDCLTDATGAFFLLAAVWAALHLRDSTTPVWKSALLVGMFAAGAITAKWTNGGTVALPLIALTGLLAVFRNNAPGADAPAPRKLPPRHLLPALAAATAITSTIAFLIWLPWGAWLTAVRGNPFHPFLASIFPSPDWTPAQQAFLIEAHAPLSPFSPAYWGNLIRRLVVGLPGLPLIALAIVAGLGALAYPATRQSIVRARNLALPVFLLIALILGALLWGQLRHAADRFLVPTLLAAVILLGWLASVRPMTGILPRGIVFAIVAFLVLLGLSTPIRSVRALEFSAHATGRRAWAAQWSENLGGVNAAMIEAANSLPPGSRLLTLNEARRYFFLTPARVTSVFDRHPLLDHLPPVLEAGVGPKALRNRLRNAGYTHLLVNDFEALRILHTHPGDRLLADSAFRRWRALPLGQAMNTPGVLDVYGEQAEFPLAPLPGPQRLLYRDFLHDLRREAVWSTHPDPAVRPAMWIAPL